MRSAKPGGRGVDRAGGAHDSDGGFEHQFLPEVCRAGPGQTLGSLKIIPSPQPSLDVADTTIVVVAEDLGQPYRAEQRRFRDVCKVSEALALHHSMLPRSFRDRPLEREKNPSNQKSSRMPCGFLNHPNFKMMLKYKQDSRSNPMEP